MKRNIIVAIDGPAGSGKSTISKILAKKLNLLYIDTGAMYRALTLGVIENKIDTGDTVSIIRLAQNCRIRLENTSLGEIKVFFDDNDVTDAIRTQKVNLHVSDVAKIKEVREIMVQRQRQLGSEGNVVLEGRDIATVVFPDARFKFFIDASASERANRRYLEMKDEHNITLDQVQDNVSKRDHADSKRSIAPLKVADDAIRIDTTEMTIEEVVSKLISYIK